jgi:hypothetical protein
MTAACHVMQTAAGVCLPHFEQQGCLDSAGAALGQDAIRQRVERLWSLPPDHPDAAAARAWLDDNDHLFRSRRCG